MKKKSTGRSEANAKRETDALRTMPDSEVDFSDIPLQNPNDPKWQNAVVGRFYRPIKQPIAMRVDSDIIAWLKSKGAGYQSRINAILREAMLREKR